MLAMLWSVPVALFLSCTVGTAALAQDDGDMEHVITLPIVLEGTVRHGTFQRTPIIFRSRTKPVKPQVQLCPQRGKLAPFDPFQGSVSKPESLRGRVQHVPRSPWRAFLDFMSRPYDESGGGMPAPGSWSSVESPHQPVMWDPHPIMSSSKNLLYQDPGTIPSYQQLPRRAR